MRIPRLLLLFLLVVLPSAVVASLAWADRTSSDRLAAGMLIGGVDVGGLTTAEAVERVWRKTRPRAMRPVRVTVGGRTYTLKAQEAGLRLRLPMAVARAERLSRRGGMLTRGWRAVTGGEVDHEVALTPSVSRTKIERFVQRIEQAVEVPARDAAMRIEVAAVVVDRERLGTRLAGRRALVARIRRVLLDRAGSRTLAARIERVRPDVTRDELWAARPIAVTVSRSDRRVRVFRRGALVKTYRVAVGERRSPTPVGQYEVQSMQKNPTWYVPQSEWAGKLAGKTIGPDDPRNPLIARWIGFNGAVGFHGTKSVDSLGRAASRGCVRMLRADVIDLYQRVAVGTPVLVGR